MTHERKAGIALAVAIVIGLAAYGFTHTTQPASESNATSTGNAEGGRKMSFGDFAKQKGTHECTLDQIIAGISTKGTIYMDKGLLRGDVLQSTPTSSPLTSSFIMRDGYVYYWNTVLPQGIKMKYNIDNYTAGDFSQFDQVSDYNCKEWTVDASKFKVPTNIQFQEMN